MAEIPNLIQRKMKMKRKPSPPPAPPLLLLLLLASVMPSSAAAGDCRSRRQLGFFYTRHRGRCTPQYWSSVVEEHWPKMVPPASTVWKAFGSRAVELRYGSRLTLQESTVGGHGNQDSFHELLRQGTAALLNSYARNAYPFRPWEVKSLVIQATVSEPAAVAQARVFAAANEACN